MTPGVCSDIANVNPVVSKRIKLSASASVMYTACSVCISYSSNSMRISEDHEDQ